ncbi:Gpi1-domain-containing protein [Trametes elegans]|nr:Gpi1-domain-containing protein [Trametes elegans]
MKATTVLWPADVLPCEGICYGWRRPLLLVAGVVKDNRDEGEVGRSLTAALDSPQWRAVQDMFSEKPTLIGYSVLPMERASLPLFRRLHPTEDDVACQIVFYRRYRRQSMRFYAFDFSELDILPSQASAGDPIQVSMKNADAILCADFSRLHSPGARKGMSLDGAVLTQANFAQHLADMVDSRPLRIGSSEGAQTDTTSSQVPRNASTARLQGAGDHFGQRLALLQRFARRVHVATRDFSATTDQLDVRFEQGVYVAREVPHVYGDKARTVTSISKYIKFHNCVWLVLNDVIIGVAFGSFFCENQYILARLLEQYTQRYLVDRMQLALLWLNNWPAGLKLNTELSEFYCYSLIGVVSAFGWLLKHAAPYFPTLIWLIGLAGCCGMTMIVSLLSDVLSVLTVHLYACYLISATVFSQQLSLAGSLWNLFRGKRYNVLRNRIDTWDYELDQLLLGTILFTLLAFLYPTVLTYYALFATARLAIMMIHAVFDTVTALLNHFPLFALLLRAKDPLRLPGGVCIELSKTGSLILASQPAPLSSIFRHYGESFAHV